jgi:hypothetical protein
MREKRYVSYTEALALLSRVSKLSAAVRPKDSLKGDELAGISTRTALLKENFPDIASRFKLLGPNSIDRALGEAAKAFESTDSNLAKAAELKLISSMRSVLKIKDK